MTRKTQIILCAVGIAVLVLITAIFIISRETLMGWIGTPTGTGTVTVRFSEGLEFVLSPDGNEYYVAGIGSCADTKINVPPTHKGLPVTRINECAFKESEISAVRIPGSVERIEAEAFYGCASLESFIPEEGLTAVAQSAFTKCTALGKLALPQSLEDIEKYAFRECTALSEVSFPSGCNISRIDEGAFNSCTALESVSIPTSAPLTEICGYVFENCTSLSRIVIPDTVKRIENYAFANCTSLSVIEIGRSLESMGDLAFIYCGNIGKVDISSENGSFVFESGCLMDSRRTVIYRGTNFSAPPDTVVTINQYAFSCCDELKEFRGGENLTSIGSSAFFGCHSLASVDLPSGVRLLETRLFQECKSLSAVTVRANAPECRLSPFKGCASLSYILFTEGEEARSSFLKTYKSSNSDEFSWTFPSVGLYCE